jgi:hypothetical protein
MRLNVKQHILNYEGKPLMTNKTNSDGSVVLGKDNKPVQEPETLRSYLVIALNNKAQNEAEATGAEELAKRYQLSTKLYAKNEVDLTHTECTLLEARVAGVFAHSPLLVGRITDVLNEREISLPEDDSDEQDDAVVAKNLDLTNAAAKDPGKPTVQANKKADGGE